MESRDKGKLYVTVLVFLFLGLFSLILTDSGITGFVFYEEPDVDQNVTVDEEFSCRFTPDADGTANVTWYVDRNDGTTEHWTADDVDDLSVDGHSEVSVSADNAASNTTKGEEWFCQVTLFNGTDTDTVNSTSSVLISNSLPEITYPEQSTVIQHYEDDPFSKYANATDPDGDEIRWSAASPASFDFSISDDGLMTFEVTNESQAGNHTVDIIAKDDSDDGHVRTVTFEIFPVNDSPEFGSLNFSCTEFEACTGTIPATDEEDDDLTFDSNISSLINLDPNTGEFNFTPEREHVGIIEAAFNVTDGVNDAVSETGHFNITSTNLAPNISLVSASSQLQNESETPFIVEVSASDLDYDDTLDFSTSTACPLNPWDINKTVELNESTNATALINVSFFDDTTWNEETSSSNDFVRCRNMSITVDDGHLSDTLDLVLNITNVNDPPTIHQLSHYDSNGRNNTNISDLKGAKLLPFDYRVNATDPDLLTYEAENESLSYSISGGNSSHFTINSSTGLIFTEELDVRGNLSFNVTVSDFEGLNDTHLLNLTVIDNEAPNITSLDASACEDGVLCKKYFNATDKEGDNLTFKITEFAHLAPDNSSRNVSLLEDMDGVFNYSIDFFNFNGSSTSYLLNFTPEDVDVGSYNVSFYFEDDFGIMTNDSLVFNITNRNDDPILNTSDLQEEVVVENTPVDVMVTAHDDDLLYDLDNLSFNMSFVNSSDNITDYTFSKHNMTSARFSFHPNSTHVGNHTVNVSVTDNASAIDYHVFDITVHPESIPPDITRVRPWFDSASNTTESSFTEVDDQDFDNINTSEDTAFTFAVEATDDEAANMTASWYINGSLVHENPFTDQGEFSYDHSFDFFDAGVHNITVVVEDIYHASSSYTWNLTVDNVNRKPEFINPLEDYSFNNSKSLNGYAKIFDFFRLRSDDIVFLDPDDDRNSNGLLDEAENNTLSFSVSANSSCRDYLDFEFDGPDVAITPNSVGTCYATFIATDPHGAGVASNDVRFDITNVEDSASSSTTSSSSSGTKTVTERITIPLEEEVDVPEEFELIKPGISSIYDNGTVVIPITLHNTWEDDITSISLSANASFPTNMTFSEDYVASIQENGRVDLNLTLDDYRFEGPFQINITAHIDSLDHIDTETIYVNALEKAKEDMDAVRSRIGFARDLLSDNPECQELNELLDRARNGSISETESSLEMVNNVVKGCKYMINNERSEPASETPKSFMGRLDTYGNALFDFDDIGTVLGVLFVAAFIIGLLTLVTLKRI